MSFSRKAVGGYKGVKDYGLRPIALGWSNAVVYCDSDGVEQWKNTNISAPVTMDENGDVYAKAGGYVEKYDALGVFQWRSDLQFSASILDMCIDDAYVYMTAYPDNRIWRITRDAGIATVARSFGSIERPQRIRMSPKEVGFKLFIQSNALIAPAINGAMRNVLMTRTGSVTNICTAVYDLYDYTDSKAAGINHLGTAYNQIDAPGWFGIVDDIQVDCDGVLIESYNPPGDKAYRSSDTLYGPPWMYWAQGSNGIKRINLSTDPGDIGDQIDFSPLNARSVQLHPDQLSLWASVDGFAKRLDLDGVEIASAAISHPGPANQVAIATRDLLELVAG